MQEKKKKEDPVPYVPLTQNKFGLWALNVVDPLGSYTGCPIAPFDEPVQDADDL